MTARCGGCLFGVFSVLFVACVGDPLKGNHFACDPSVKDSCERGFICVPVVHEKVKGVCLTRAEVEAHDIKLGDHDVGISEQSCDDTTPLNCNQVCQQALAEIQAKCAQMGGTIENPDISICLGACQCLMSKVPNIGACFKNPSCPQCANLESLASESPGEYVCKIPQER